MKQSLRLGRVAGIAIGVQWSALVIGALIALTLATGILPSALPHQIPEVYWAVAVPGAVLFLACLLAHELAHSLVALHYRIRVRSITLWMLGGVSELEREAPDAKSDLAVAAAGPLTSLVLGGLFAAAATVASDLRASPLIVSMLVWLAVINIILGVFNLLPGAPLDGGRVLRALLWRRYHDRSRADLAAAGAGRVLGFTIVFLGLVQVTLLGTSIGLWTILMGWFLMTAARAEASSRIVRDALKNLRVRDVMTAEPDTGAGWQRVDVFLDQVVLLSRQNVFPVLDFDGEPVGAVTTESLSHVPAHDRAELLLRDIAVPLPESNRCGPDDAAAELALRPPVAGRLIAVVMDGRRLVGMVTVDDLQRTAQRGLLNASRP